MNKIAVLLACLATSCALAQGNDAGRNVTFSKYSPLSQLASYDEKTHTHEFHGTIRLTGTLFLVFDMEASDRANGEINFRKFVPDPESTAQLPAVVQGFYSGAVRYVNLDAPLDQLVGLFGGKETFTRLSHGTLHEVSERAEVVLDSYSATVECDSRTYWGHTVSVKALSERRQTASRGSAPHGC